jgi:hypothetical protein
MPEGLRASGERQPENVKIACESVIEFTGDKTLAEY